MKRFAYKAVSDVILEVRSDVIVEVGDIILEGGSEVIVETHTFCVSSPFLLLLQK